MVNIRNPNDVMTDEIALGPSKTATVYKSATSYNQPGLPTPPAGWNRQLGYDVKYAPDTCA